MKMVNACDIWHIKNISQLKIYHNRLIFNRSQANSQQKDSYRWALCTLENGAVKELATFTQELNFVLIDINHALFIEDNIIKQIDLNTGLIKELDVIASQVQLSLADLIGNGKLLLTGSISLQQPAANYKVIDELPSYFNGLGFVNKKRQHLFYYDLTAQQLKDLIADQYFNVHDFCLAGEQIVIAGDSYQHKRPVIPSLYSLNIKTLALEQLYGPGEFDASTSLFYNQIFFLNQQCFLLGNDDPHTLNKNPQFYKLLVNGHRELAAGWDHSLGSWIGTDQAMGHGNVSQVFANKYFFVSTIVDHAEIFAFDGQTVKPYYAFSGNITAFAFCDSDKFYFIGMAANKTQQLYLYDHGQVSMLYDPNCDYSAQHYVAQAKEVAYTATDNLPQHGWILFPKDYQEGKKYPGILEIHGGPKTAYGTVFYHEMQLYASHGYFVFFCNIHGSDGQGNTFSNISGHWGEKDYQDLMNFTDTVLKQYPQIDENRLGVAGGSYGGFMTNWIIGHTTRFSAACSQRSIASEFSHSYLSDIGPDDNMFENQANIYSDPHKMWQHSPLAYSDKVKTPTLFINSDEDHRCPPAEGMQMLHSLLHNGVAAKMCLFHGENHELSRSGRPINRISRLQEMLAWFDYYLK